MTTTPIVVKGGGVDLLATGKIVVDARYCKKLGTNVTVYPVGFTSARKGPSKDGKQGNSVVFTSTITEGPNGPLFTVTAGDDASGVYAADSPSAAWIAALAHRVTGDKVPLSNGPQKFGLTVDVVVAELKKLEGYDALVALVSGSDDAPQKAKVPKAKEPTDTAAVATTTETSKPKRASKKVDEANSAASATTSSTELTEQTVASEASPAGPKKRPRTSTALAPKCELCGLSSPFCPQSGKMHAFAITPCPVCKKVTLFCCETGQAHAPAHQPTAPAAASAEAPSTAVETPAAKASRKKPDGAAVKAPRKPKTETTGPVAGVEGVEGADAAAAIADGTAPKAAKRARKEKPAADGDAAGVVGADGVAAPPAPSKGKRQRTLDEVAKKPADVPEDVVVVVKEVLPPPPPPPPKPFVYPPLRAVVAKIDHVAFAKALSAPDEATKKRMEIDGVTTAAAVKRYTQFQAMYVSEKTVQDAAKAAKASAKANEVPAAAATSDAAGEAAEGDAVPESNAGGPSKQKSKSRGAAKSAEATPATDDATPSTE